MVTKQRKTQKAQSLSEESRRFAAAIARDLNRVLNRVEQHGGCSRQPSKETQLYHILRKLQMIAGGAPCVIDGDEETASEYPEVIRELLKGPEV